MRALRKKNRRGKPKKMRTQPPARPAAYFHYTEQYLLAPNHPVTVKLLGCGGSGSQMIQQLARIHVSLLHLGHPGLALQAWDPDKVTEANLGRQLFSQADLDQYKARILVERINRFYGIGWQAFHLKYEAHNLKESAAANIMITCTDNVQARELVQSIKGKGINRNVPPFAEPYYWLDLGNARTTGQVVLGTLKTIKKPKRTQDHVCNLPTILDYYPDLKAREDKDATPSCSLAEALGRQDLFINSTLAQYGANLIWKLFRELRIQHHGVYVNLDTLTTNPIPVKP